MKRIVSLALAFGLGLAHPILAAAATADSTQAQQEEQIGKQFYAQMQQKGEIIPSSPYYAILNPIAKQIKRIADPQYYFPFTFILVHEAQPNAFAVPGGNVYVTDSLMKFVKNREELAGVLCHETSHDIHHDVIHNMGKEQRAATNIGLGALAAQILTGGRYGNLINTGANLGFQAVYGGYSRPVETAADLKGADTCAEAGSNPWGMVWLFQQFSQAGSGGTLEMLSDHPTDNHRIADLEAHFAANPRLFAKYPKSIAYATPLGSTPRRYGYVNGRMRR